jgi:hypothetical protein
MNSHAFAPFFFVLLLPLSGLSQKRLSTESGVVSFVSKAELELIKASSNKAVGLLTSNLFKGLTAASSDRTLMKIILKATNCQGLLLRGRSLKKLTWA